MIRILVARLTIVALILAGLARSLPAQSQKPTIVLVHGAWADASGWYDVTLALQARGYKVVAVQNSLFSYAKDVETTKRGLAAPPGPILVVGHSSGGARITAPARGTPHITFLAYV